MKSIYLDHAASSPVHPEVIKVMVDVMESDAANPSSIHRYGREARKLVDSARQTIAQALGARMDEIIFTSGGTEADNLAILGIAQAWKHKGKHIITSKIEHHAVLHTCKQLEKEGFEITYLEVDGTGHISLEDLAQALRDDTILVTIMLGNNEVGSIQALKEISKILDGHQAFLHTDAVQAFGMVDIDVNDLGVDLLSVSAHKINGPKGIGCLYSSLKVKLNAISFGGEQERKRRAGTENVPGIVGFAKAVSIAATTREEKGKSYQQFKQQLLSHLDQNQVPYMVNGDIKTSLPHILNISFPGTDVESMLMNLDLEGIAVSSGSACTAGSIDPSHVLVAMYGDDSDRVRNSIRFSFGYNNTEEEIAQVAEKTVQILKRLLV